MNPEIAPKIHTKRGTSSGRRLISTKVGLPERLWPWVRRAPRRCL
jgi:hypothetical protein